MTNTAPVVSSASVEIDRQQLRTLRQNRGLTQVQLGELCSLSPAYISQLETGSRVRVSPPAFATICAALRIPQKQRGILRVSRQAQAA